MAAICGGVGEWGGEGLCRMGIGQWSEMWGKVGQENICLSEA